MSLRCNAPCCLCHNTQPYAPLQVSYNKQNSSHPKTYINYHYTTSILTPYSLKTDPNTPPIIPLTLLGFSLKHVITTAVLTANTTVSRHCLARA